MLNPSADKSVFIINHEQKTKTNPIIADQRTFFPFVARVGFPADIISITAPMTTAKIANGEAIFVTIKSYILASITKKHPIVQAGSPSFPQGTSPAAFTKTGLINKKNKTSVLKNIKKVFFIFYYLYFLYHNTKTKITKGRLILLEFVVKFTNNCPRGEMDIMRRFER